MAKMTKRIRCLYCRSEIIRKASLRRTMPVETVTDSPERPTGTSMPTRAPALFVCGLLLVLAGILGWNLYRQYHQEIAGGQATALSLASVLDEHAGRTFGAVDIFLLNYSETLSGMAGTSAAHDLAALRERMIARLSDLPQVRAFLVLDENGNSLVDSDSMAPRPFNGADRRYFQAHAEQ